MNILNDEIFYNDDGGMGKYIVNKLQLPPAQADPETVKKYERYGKRVLWIDDSVVPGSFQMNASWYKHSNMYVITESYQKGTDFLKPHKHETDEIVAFFGGNPEDPENLHGEIIFYINGEKHIITKSSFYFPSSRNRTWTTAHSKSELSDLPFFLRSSKTVCGKG